LQNLPVDNDVIVTDVESRYTSYFSSAVFVW